MSVSPSTYRLSQCYAVVNHDDKTACRGSSVIEDPEEFYSMIFDNYINQDIGNVLHYLDVAPSNHEKTYRRLWFDLDYHSTNKSEVEALYNNEMVNRLIMKLCTSSTKYFNMNEKDLCIVTARKPVSPKEYKDGPAFSFGMHVYTNMFVKGEYLSQLYNLLSADNEIRFYTRQLHLNFNEFVDKSVIGNPHKNNGCMFLGCSKDESLSGYKLYQSNYYIGNWFQIDDTNCDTCRSYFNQTLLNYPSPIDKFVDSINVELFDIQDNVILETWNVDVDSVNEYLFQKFELKETVRKSAGKQYIIRIYSNDMEHSAPSVTNYASYEEGNLQFGNNAQIGSLIFTLNSSVDFI